MDEQKTFSKASGPTTGSKWPTWATGVVIIVGMTAVLVFLALASK